MNSMFRKLFPMCLLILLSCKQSVPAVDAVRSASSKAEEEVVKEEEIYSETKDDAVLLPQISVDTLALRFIENLSQDKNLNTFFSEKWTLVYHTDNRCEGSTDGKLANLEKFEIDTNIKLSVKNDGDGWACDKSAPTEFDLNFNIKNEVKSWDRFIIQNYEEKKKNIIYISGKGESDYLKLHFSKDNLIIKLEYRSEDPG